jgi:hypothetical protein
MSDRSESFVLRASDLKVAYAGYTALSIEQIDVRRGEVLVVVGANGEILLKATKNVTLEKNSVITANGPQGGKVSIQSDTGTVAVSGTLEANGTQGKGGSISVSAPAGITVDAARISANGTTDGGSVSFVSTGNVTIAAPVTANAGSGRAGEVAVRAGTVYLNAGALLAASGGVGGGAVGVRGANG